MSPRLLQNQIKQDFRADSSVWSNYRSTIVSNFANIDYQDLSDHLLREFNRKVVSLGLSEDLMFVPFDSGFRFLGATIGSDLDADAQAYINAISAAGATVTATQQSAINTFITTGKTEGWYSSLKRLYLPIWEVAEANAICMVSLTNLTFYGGITHGAGFIQGNGSTGYADTNTTPSSIGLTKDSYYGGFLRILNSPVDCRDFGITSGTGNFLYENDWYYDNDLEENFFNGEVMRISSNFLFQNQSPVTLLSMGGTTSSRFIKDRTSSGVVTRATSSITNTSEITDINLYLMSANFNNTPASRSSSRYGAFFFGTAMSDLQDTAFTLALKNLWETTTELTIP